MIKEEHFVSAKIGKLLKDHGFDELCEWIYGISVRHNGKDISFCDECELKDEGREDEIEYVDYSNVMSFVSRNSELGDGACSMPRYTDVFDWIEKNFNIYISVYPLFKECDDICWTFDICDLKEKTLKQMSDVDTSRVKIMENAIMCVLEKTYLTEKEII